MVKKFGAVLLLGVVAGALAFSVIPAFAVAGAGEQERGCERELDAASAAFDQAFVDRDFDAFMGFIADDAIQIDFLGQIFENKEEIAGFTQAVMANEYTFTHTLLHRPVHKCESATVIQDTVFAIPSRNFSLRLEDTVGWVRDQGVWKVVLIQNTEIAEPAGS